MGSSGRPAPVDALAHSRHVGTGTRAHSECSGDVAAPATTSRRLGDAAGASVGSASREVVGVRRVRFRVRARKREVAFPETRLGDVLPACPPCTDGTRTRPRGSRSSPTQPRRRRREASARGPVADSESAAPSMPSGTPIGGTRRRVFVRGVPARDAATAAVHGRGARARHGCVCARRRACPPPPRAPCSASTPGASRGARPPGSRRCSRTRNTRRAPLIRAGVYVRAVARARRPRELTVAARRRRERQ